MTGGAPALQGSCFSNTVYSSHFFLSDCCELLGVGSDRTEAAAPELEPEPGPGPVSEVPIPGRKQTISSLASEGED